MEAAEQRTHVELPPHISPPFDVFVNGVEQVEGDDYDIVGAMLVFDRAFAHEGKLGFWRWLSLFLGVAGSYRKHDSVDVVYTLNGRKAVASLNPQSTPF